MLCSESEFFQVQMSSIVTICNDAVGDNMQRGIFRLGMSSELKSSTKVLRQFSKTNALEQTIEFCIRMKTSFSSVVTPSPPNNAAKRFVDV